MQTLTEQRASGLLMHISSLPGGHGIGDLGTSSFDFIDFLADAGQSYWQILPLGPVSPIFGNSPYMSYSAFAGNPLLISLDILQEEGYLQIEDLPSFEFSQYIVSFETVSTLKQAGLQSAWKSFRQKHDIKIFDSFLANHTWVTEYAFFMALKDEYKHAPWTQWPEELKTRDPETLQKVRVRKKEQINYYLFEQYIFFRQWEKLHRYAYKKDIKIIGDLPIYVAHDSSDVWANQSIFELNPVKGTPTHVAGVPPDYFSKTGQRWGNPLYRWNTKEKKVKKGLFDWWAKRLQTTLSIVDVIRIDHFRGFAAYWSIPAAEKTAVNGSWKKGPGKIFFREMEKKLGNLPVIAEDLGFITPEVEKLRDDLKYPGMKILLFAFTNDPKNSYLPQNIDKNCVIYTGTHDNATAVGWFLTPEISLAKKKWAKACANKDDLEASTFHKDLLYLAQTSVACLSIIPFQDILGFGNDCRMNTPGTTKGNWQWRCAKRFFTREAAESLHKSTRLANRLPTIQKKSAL